MHSEFRAVVVGGGELYVKDTLLAAVAKAHLVIAADGGYDTLLAAGILPSMVVGDMDSIKASVPPEVQRLEYTPEKDQTDMFLAIGQAVERGAQVIEVFGAFGGRLDHALANLQVLAHFTHRGKKLFYYGKAGRCLTAVENGTLHLPAQPSGYLSVFAHTDIATSVQIKGAKYPLVDGRLTNTFPLGVSNEFLGEAVEVSVGQGMLIVDYQIAAEVLQAAQEIKEN
jgi:thiamine pyrophosphokinase